MNLDLISDLNNISKFALGAYRASDNAAFGVIHENLNIIIQDLQKPSFIAQEKLLDSDICELDFSVRTIRALKAENINLIKDLLVCSIDRLRKTPNLGRKSIAEIEEVLQKHGLKINGN